MSNQLEGKVALVAGATRGAGRGIAVALGEAGATVYCTGRSTRGQRSEYDRPETIEETAELVDAAGGTGVAVVVDHLDPAAVRELVARIDADHGRLDLLVNDIWGGEKLFSFDTPLWEHDLDDGLRLLRLAVETHLVTSHAALPLLIRRPGGLVVEMTDGTRDYNESRLRVNPFYDLAKASVLRLAFAQAKQLEPHGCAAVALTPGWMRSEMMLEVFGVSEDELERAGQGTAALRRHLREPPVRGPRRGRAGRRPEARAGATAARSPPASWRGSTASPTWTAPSPTAGDTWSRSRTRGCRRIRPGTARRPRRARRRRGGRR